WLLQRSPWKKRLAGMLFDRRNQRSADVLHATCAQELQTIRDAQLTQPVAVIPPGIDTPPKGIALRWLSQHESLRGKRLAVFLGIMDRKKGLLRLAQAWGKLYKQRKDWHVVIAGGDDYGHGAEVQAAFEAHGC